MNWWFRVLMEVHQIKEKGQTPISRWIIQQTPSLPCCVSIKQMFRLKSVSAFGVRPIEIRQLVLNGNVAGKLITDWWSRNVLQLQAIDYRLEDNSIFNPRLQLISSIYPPRPHISLWSTQYQNSHRLNCISPSIPCLLNLWNLVLVTHSVREFDGFR